MFTFAIDALYEAGVGVFSGATNDDADYERYVRALEDFSERWRDRPQPVFIQVVDRDNPPPNAAWRRRIAEASENAPPQTLYCFVSESALARGVLTAISWLAPRRFETHVCRDFDEAKAIVQERLGGSVAFLDALLEKARAEAG